MASSFPYLRLAKRFGISYRTVLKCADLIESGNIQMCGRYLGGDETMLASIYNAIVFENVRRCEVMSQEGEIPPQLKSLPGISLQARLAGTGFPYETGGAAQ